MGVVEICDVCGGWVESGMDEPEHTTIGKCVCEEFDDEEGEEDEE